jgi:hypothetical protein
MIIGIIISALLLLSPVFPDQAMAAEAPQFEGPAVGERFGWVLADAKVVNRGKTAATAGGIITTGYTVEALATAMGKAPITVGKFKLTITVFSPSREMPGQKPGRYYVRGDWTITDESAAPELLKIKHNPAAVKGRLLADLPFNPLKTAGSVTATLQVPRLAGGRGLGKGTFTGNANFEGTIQMALRR